MAVSGGRSRCPSNSHCSPVQPCRLSSMVAGMTPAGRSYSQRDTSLDSLPRCFIPVAVTPGQSVNIHIHTDTHTHTDRWVLKLVAAAPSRTSVHTWCSVVSALDCGQCPPHSGGRGPAARGGQRSPPGSGGACCGAAYPPGLCQPLATRHTITTLLHYVQTHNDTAYDITTAYDYRDV